MRAILEDPRSGQVSVYETPEPELRAGGILVRTHFSVISAGTERAKLEAGQKSLMGKALQRPDLVQQVIDYARANGVWAAYHKVRSRLDNLSPLGYSCAGIIIATGLGVTEFRPGDRVACGGAGYANRSEEHTSELQSQSNLVCRLLLEKKKNTRPNRRIRSS